MRKSCIILKITFLLPLVFFFFFWGIKSHTKAFFKTLTIKGGCQIKTKWRNYISSIRLYFVEKLKRTLSYRTFLSHYDDKAWKYSEQKFVKRSVKTLGNFISCAVSDQPLILNTLLYIVKFMWHDLYIQM